MEIYSGRETNDYIVGELIDTYNSNYYGDFVVTSKQNLQKYIMRLYTTPINDSDISDLHFFYNLQNIHPNITRRYKSIYFLGKFAILYEYYEWTNLDTIVSRLAPLIEEERESFVLKFLYQALHALNYMHSRKVIYRYLQRTSFHILANGQVKLSDIPYLNTEIDTQFLKYIAPEYYMDLNHTDDNANADIWSLGLIILEIFTGKLFTENKIPSEIKNVNIDRLIDRHIQNTQLKNLLSSMLTLNYKTRITSNNALRHPLYQEYITTAVGKLFLTKPTIVKHLYEINLSVDELIYNFGILSMREFDNWIGIHRILSSVKNDKRRKYGPSYDLTTDKDITAIESELKKLMRRMLDNIKICAEYLSSILTAILI